MARFYKEPNGSVGFVPLCVCPLCTCKPNDVRLSNMARRILRGRLFNFTQTELHGGHRQSSIELFSKCSRRRR